jgi:hypothetical protein
VTEIDTLFDLLDAWRHFPGYPLERHAVLYFALYLPEVLGTQFGFRSTNAQENVINFRAFAEVVARHDDALSRRFAQSLREWAAVQAGEG